jgi:hypothetical protein
MRAPSSRPFDARALEHQAFLVSFRAHQDNSDSTSRSPEHSRRGRIPALIFPSPLPCVIQSRRGEESRILLPLSLTLCHSEPPRRRIPNPSSPLPFLVSFRAALAKNPESFFPSPFPCVIQSRRGEESRILLPLSRRGLCPTNHACPEIPVAAPKVAGMPNSAIV